MNRWTWRRVRDEVEGLVERAGDRVTSGSSSSTSRNGRPSSQAGAGVALDDAVGGVAARARRHQGQQHRLAEDQAVAALGQVGQRPLGVDDEALDQARGLAQHVVGQQAGVGEDDPLDRAVRDVPLVPQGHVLEARADR